MASKYLPTVVDMKGLICWSLKYHSTSKNHLKCIQTHFIELFINETCLSQNIYSMTFVNLMTFFKWTSTETDTDQRNIKYVKNQTEI